MAKSKYRIRTCPHLYDVWYMVEKWTWLGWEYQTKSICPTLKEAEQFVEYCQQHGCSPYDSHTVKEYT